MSSFTRSDTSVLGRWWWTVDRWTIVALGLLIGIGVVLVLAASPSAADRIGLDSFYFVRRQLVLLPAAIAVMFATSLLPPQMVRRAAVALLIISLILIAATLLVGTEIKGAKRWLQVANLSLQPSEFIKPALAVVAGWMMAEQRLRPGFPGHAIAGALCLLATGLLLAQPDLGMAAVVTGVWAVQVFLAGLPLAFMVGLAGLGVGGLIVAYFVFPHVAKRIDQFLDPAVGDSYQVDVSLEAFRQGGLLGRGPGEGTVKVKLPDAHADFVFAVAGEELGLIVCLVIVALFAFVVLRGFSRLMQEQSLFVLLAVTGLLVQFGLQALVNMASTLNLIPTKGMTLPFLSYGGSSLLAIAIGMGMVLALTRRRAGGAPA